jgi:hypothetical protein
LIINPKVCLDSFSCATVASYCTDSDIESLLKLSANSVTDVSMCPQIGRPIATILQGSVVYFRFDAIQVIYDIDYIHQNKESANRATGSK